MKNIIYCFVKINVKKKPNKINNSEIITNGLNSLSVRFLSSLIIFWFV